MKRKRKATHPGPQFSKKKTKVNPKGAPKRMIKNELKWIHNIQIKMKNPLSNHPEVDTIKLVDFIISKTDMISIMKYNFDEKINEATFFDNLLEATEMKDWFKKGKITLMDYNKYVTNDVDYNGTLEIQTLINKIKKMRENMDYYYTIYKHIEDIIMGNKFNASIGSQLKLLKSTNIDRLMRLEGKKIEDYVVKKKHIRFYAYIYRPYKFYGYSTSLDDLDGSDPDNNALNVIKYNAKDNNMDLIFKPQMEIINSINHRNIGKRLGNYKYDICNPFVKESIKNTIAYNLKAKYCFIHQLRNTKYSKNKNIISTINQKNKKDKVETIVQTQQEKTNLHVSNSDNDISVQEKISNDNEKKEKSNDSPKGTKDVTSKKTQSQTEKKKKKKSSKQKTYIPTEEEMNEFIRNYKKVSKIILTCFNKNETPNNNTVKKKKINLNTARGMDGLNKRMRTFFSYLQYNKIDAALIVNVNGTVQGVYTNECYQNKLREVICELTLKDCNNSNCNKKVKNVDFYCSFCGYQQII